MAIGNFSLLGLVEFLPLVVTAWTKIQLISGNVAPLRDHCHCYALFGMSNGILNT